MKKGRTLIAACLGILLLAAILWRLYEKFLPDIQNLIALLHQNQTLLTHITAHQRDPIVLLGLIIIVMLMTAIPFMPISVFCIAIGAAYGSVFGVFLNILGISLGNLLLLTVLKKTGLSVHIQDRNMKLIDDITKMRHPLLGLTIGYTIPVVPTLFVNLAAIHLDYRLRQLVLPVLVGSIPVAVIYALGGHLFRHGNVKIGIIVILIALLLYGLITIIKKDRRRKEASSDAL